MGRIPDMRRVGELFGTVAIRGGTGAAGRIVLEGVARDPTRLIEIPVCVECTERLLKPRMNPAGAVSLEAGIAPVSRPALSPRAQLAQDGPAFLNSPNAPEWRAAGLAAQELRAAKPG